MQIPTISTRTTLGAMENVEENVVVNINRNVDVNVDVNVEREKGIRSSRDKD